MKVIGEAIAGLKIELSAILTSPYRRASQTAEAVAHALNLPAKIEPSLEPGFDAAALGALIERQGGGDLMVVGHEPDFSAVISHIIGGGRVVCKKGGLAFVDLQQPLDLKGELVWLIPPKLLGA